MATLIKNGTPLLIKVIGGEDLEIHEGFKNVVHSILGDKEIYEYIGKSDQKITFSLFLENKDEYDSLISFFRDGKPFAFRVVDFEGIYNLKGGVKSKRSFKDGSFLADITLTSADNLQFVGGLFESNEALDPYQSSSSKSDWIKSLADYANDNMDFTSDDDKFSSNLNSTIASYTGKFQEYSTAITQVTGGVGSTSTIITAPLSSVRNSSSSIIGGVASVVSSLGTAINAIKQTPDNISDMIDSILDIGEKFSNIFKNDDKSQQSKQTISFLIDTGNALVEVAQEPLSLKTVTQSPYSVSFDPELPISSIGNKNVEILSVLMLSSILISIYESSSQLSNWNKQDLDNILKQTNLLFNYVMSKDLSSEARSNVVYARNSFFRSFRSIYESSLNFVTIEVREPRFLTDIVYSVNGNFDHYLETKKLNNILGSITQGFIKVISND